MRDMAHDDLPFDCSLLVADLSFISLTKVVQAFVAVLRAEPEYAIPQLVVLVKPQFEAGRSEVSKGRGVITDPAVHLQACETVSEALAALGCTVRGIVESPIKGAEGNTEFLLFADCPTSSVGLES